MLYAIKPDEVVVYLVMGILRRRWSTACVGNRGVSETRGSDLVERYTLQGGPRRSFVARLLSRILYGSNLTS